LLKLEDLVRKTLREMGTSSEGLKREGFQGGAFVALLASGGTMLQ